MYILHDTIFNPINYHPDQPYDYGSNALSDVRDAERHFEDVKSRCECRKRAAPSSSSSSSCSNSSSSSSVPHVDDFKPTPEELDAAKKQCLMTSDSETRAGIESLGLMPIENGNLVQHTNSEGKVFHEGHVLAVKIDKESKKLTHFYYN